MDWVRSILGVALGFGVFVVGSFVPRGAAAENPGTTPGTGLIAGSIAYGVVFAALAGLTAASIAGRKQVQHALAVAVLIGAAGLLHPWLEPGTGPRWLDFSVLLMAPAAVFAGWARARIQPR